MELRSCRAFGVAISSPASFIRRRANRSDISVTVPPLSERLDRLTITVPPYAAEKVANIVYRKLKKWEGIRVLSPDDAARAMKDLGPTAKLVVPEQMARLVAERL